MPSTKSFSRDLLPALIPALLFVWIAVLATGPTAPRIDGIIRETVHRAASSPLTIIAKGITVLGSGWFLYLVLCVICILFWRANRLADAALLTAALAGAQLLEQLLKLAFHRSRPEAYFGYDRPSSYSFPSGHALVSCCFYLSLVEALIQPGWRAGAKAAARAATVLLVLAISLTRVYLGVHYPTDIAAGLTVGFTWMVVVRAAHRREWGRGAG